MTAPARAMLVLAALLARVAAAASEPADTGLRGAEDPDSLAAKRPSAGAVAVLAKDSLSLFEYHHAGDILGLIPGTRVYDLGGFGQPLWAGRHGTAPAQFALVENGIPIEDEASGRPNAYFLPTEEAREFRVYPMHQSAWYGGPGRLVTLEQIDAEWDTPRPYTRIRHTQAPYQYLYTDVLFGLSPWEDDNFHFGLTHRTNGSESQDNTARFLNDRSDDWVARVGYSSAVAQSLTLYALETFANESIYENGGVAGWLDPSDGAWMVYPDAGNASFSDSAYNPITASFLNPTLRTVRRRNAFELGARILWAGDSTANSTVRLQHVASRRTYSDELYKRGPAVARLADNGMSETYRLRFDHAMALSWMRLELGASVARTLVREPSIPAPQQSFNTMARGMLVFPLPDSRLSLFARSDMQYGRGALGAGATFEFAPSRRFLLWAGAGMTTRPPSLFERLAFGAYDTLLTPRSDASEQSAVVEGGAAYDAGWLRISGTAGYRTTVSHVSVYQRLLAADSTATVFRFGDAFDGSEVTRRVAGATLEVNLRIGLLAWDASVALTVDRDKDAPGAERLAPITDARTALYLRGNAIEGTLFLKAGASFRYSDLYHPASYNPLSDAFGLPLAGDTGAEDHTAERSLDIFVYATVKESATIHVILHNVLDTRSITTRFYPMYDRGFRFGVDWVLFD